MHGHVELFHPAPNTAATTSREKTMKKYGAHVLGEDKRK
jgi:hypothetical protein